MIGKNRYTVWFVICMLAVVSWVYAPTYTAAILLVWAFHMMLLAIWLLAKSKPRAPMPMWIFVGSLVLVGLSFLAAPAL